MLVTDNVIIVMSPHLLDLAVLNAKVAHIMSGTVVPVFVDAVDNIFTN